MKKTINLLRMVVSALVMLSALGFAAVALWQLFSGDWKLFENDRLVLMQILVKFLICLYGFSLGLGALLGKKRSYLWEGIWLLGISLAAAPFLSNGLGWAAVGIAAAFLLLEPGVRRLFPDRLR